MLAEAAGFDFAGLVGPVISAFLVSGMTAIVTAVITANRMAAVLTAKIESHTERLGKVEQIVGSHEKGIAAGDVARVQCRAESNREFASRGELSRLVADFTRASRDLTQAIQEGQDSLHGRVTELAKQVSRLAGRMEAGQLPEGRPQ